ncbi:MAG: sulfatase-like hydrolase/transferase, partial [Planctomycetota bacterium]|nr:sulfatase-like hydrolase/transferase [Planctomycetota bacterium]
MARQGRNRRRDARPAPDRPPRPRVWWRRPRVAVIVVTLVVAGCAVWWWRSSASSRPPDILLISVDTLRADHLGCYGYGLRTPNIDRLAAEGVVFEAAMAPVPLTLPSHASMLTGLIPPRHGVRANGDFRLPDRIETLAEVLQKRGYQTAAFIGAIPLDRSGGLNLGFDHYDDEISVQSVDAEKEVQRKERFANEVFDL